MNRSNNNSSHANMARPSGSYYTKEWVYAGIGLYVPLSILITLGNMLVIAAFFSTPKLKTKTNYFIVSLAFADLIVGTFSVPMWLRSLITEDFANPVYEFYLSVDMFSGISSIIHLACISLERCYAIVAPLKHMNIKKGNFYIAIFISWVLGIVAPLLKLYSGLHTIFISTFNTCAFFFAPLVVILLAYVIIFASARKSMAIRKEKSIKKDLHIAYTIALVIGIFVICWLPFFVTMLLNNFCPACRSVVLLFPYLMAVRFLHYFNSMCNPIIYCVRNKRFNMAFTRILRRIFCCINPKSRQQEKIDFRMANYRNTIRKKTIRNGEHAQFITGSCERRYIKP
ncbi:tyramine receptor Ser-2 [Exaiptasia diaphana]|uniref:G-protein coupled receptors family 1 profile domain-containing protein n=1 Tax=Exaiptasia diaphana TaxID=2652724 RepID=A0A913WT48_EXADI|nr:tyramine receptor Ser-2 [Exaiptasia diaphana]